MKKKREENLLQPEEWVEEILRLCEEVGKKLEIIEARLKRETEEAERRIEEEIRRRK